MRDIYVLQVDMFWHNWHKRVQPLERIEEILERESARGEVLEVARDNEHGSLEKQRREDLLELVEVEEGEELEKGPILLDRRQQATIGTLEAHLVEAVVREDLRPVARIRKLVFVQRLQQVIQRLSLTEHNRLFEIN